MFYEQKAKTRSIKVKEWGNKTLYFAPLCLQDLEQVNTVVGDDDVSTFCRQVHLVILKACDKSGKRILNIGDFDGLMTKADPLVMSRIIQFMSGETPEATKQDLEKND